MSRLRQRRATTTTGGREATQRVVPGDVALSVGNPNKPAPPGWNWRLLTDVARLESGHTPSRNHPEYWDGDVPWIGIRDAKLNHEGVIHSTLQTVTDEGIRNSSARMLPEGTVCLSRTASVGYVVILGKSMATSQDFVNWVCSPELEPNFLKYLLIAEKEALFRFAAGAIHQTIYYPEVKAFHVAMPPVNEQRRIVGILDEAFDGIATAKANAEKNLQNARALFESHLESVFAERGGDWEEKSLGQIGSTQTGSTPNTSDQDNFGDFIPFVKPADFNPDGSIDYGNDGLSKNGFSVARKVAANSTLMVCIGATIGKCGYSDRDVTTNQQINALTPNSGHSNKFIYYQMLTRDFQRRVILGSSQATLPIINKSKWSALTVWAPSKFAEQESIVKKFDGLLEKTKRLESIYQRKLAALDALKKSLLHQAFSGQL